MAMVIGVFVVPQLVGDLAGFGLDQLGGRSNLTRPSS
jgi:hypothetical protein